MVVAETKEILEQQVKPAIQKFLAERGLRLSEEKTVITHIKDGFNFLGKTLRKFGTQLIVQPSKAAAKSIRQKLGALLRSRAAWPMMCCWANSTDCSGDGVTITGSRSASRVFGKVRLLRAAKAFGAGSSANTKASVCVST